MVSEISILIPVYNQTAQPLVAALLLQAKELQIPYEIRVYDDGSAPEYKLVNQALKACLQVVYQEMPSNLGRSKIRYQLAQEAKFNWLLFLDNDVLPVQPIFLRNYVTKTTEMVAVGGVAYQNEFPPEAILRWKYGRAREQATAKDRSKNPYQRIFFSNLLVKREVMLSFFSANKVRGYGHEDTLFAYALLQEGVKVQHLDNPVYHLGLEPAPIFLEKTKQAIENLVFLQNEGILANDGKLVKTYQLLARWKMGFMAYVGNRLLLPILRKQLLSANPSLKAFDLYKLLIYSRYQK